MPVILARIDDRLIHGQVVVGWAGRLRPDTIVVVDDEAARDAWEGDLVCSACPESVKALVLGVDEAAERLARGDLPGKAFLVFRSPSTAVRLVKKGWRPGELNVGGLHYHEGSRACLPYVYLDDGDLENLEWLSAQGIRLTAQDIPGNRAVDLSLLLPGMKR